MEIVGALLLTTAVVYGVSTKTSEPPPEPVIVLSVEHRDCNFEKNEVRYRNLKQTKTEQVYLKDNLPCVVRIDTMDQK